MTVRLSRYLEQIQKEENITFAIDSIPKQDKKKKKMIRPTYSKAVVEEENEVNTAITPKRIMVDLDGTIHRYSKGFQDGSLYDDPFPQAKEALQKLKSQGFEIVIFTSRVSPEVVAYYGENLKDQYINIANWLSNNEIPFDRITASKLDADFYIDDRAIYIKNGNWQNVLNEIDKRSNKKKD